MTSKAKQSKTGIGPDTNFQKSNAHTTIMTEEYPMHSITLKK